MSNLTNEQKDIIEIKAKMERLENHFKTYKSDVSDIKESLSEVRTLLGGSELNGRKGFIKLMESVEEKVNIFENEIIAIKKDIDQSKFWGRTAVLAITACVAFLLRQFFDKG